MARGAPASRLSHVLPDVCAGGPCGRTFPHVCACAYRVKGALADACARARAYTHTRAHTHAYTRARVHASVLRALLYEKIALLQRCRG